MPGKRTNGYRSHFRDERKPRVASEQKQREQTWWRKDCLRKRAAEGTLTAKNYKEAERLGISGFVVGEIAPGITVSGTI
jgi:hypothetical protein